MNQTMTTNNTPNATASKGLQRLACWLGRHKWTYHGDYFVGCRNNDHVTILWMECPHCYKSKLQGVYRG